MAMSAETAVMSVTEEFNKKVSIDDSTSVEANGISNGNSAPSINNKLNNNTNNMMQPPPRRVARNKSGPLGRLASSSSSGAGGPRSRAPPGRSKSHKIGRPNFDPTLSANNAEPTRGVNRSKSGRSKAAPGRAGSFNRRAPDRSSSASSSLRARRLQQQQSGESLADDDISVTDSVFTSASIQTLDSIAVRKKQIDHDVPVVAGMRGQRPRDGTIEFDESLHTVDSMHLNHKHVSEEYYDDECDDLSVFSESFGSTASCDVLSDFEEDEMDGAIEEDEDETAVKSDGDENME